MKVLLLLLLLRGFHLVHLERHLLGQQAWIVWIVGDHVISGPLSHASKETWNSIPGCNQVGNQLPAALRAFMTFKKLLFHHSRYRLVECLAWRDLLLLR